MEALLIINSALIAICLYFVKDFHGDFKEVTKTVNGLKQQFTDLSVKVKHEIKSVKKRVSKVDKSDGSAA